MKLKLHFFNLSVNYFFSTFITESYEKAFQKTLIYLSYCSSMILFVAIFISFNVINNIIFFAILQKIKTINH